MLYPLPNHRARPVDLCAIPADQPKQRRVDEPWTTNGCPQLVHTLGPIAHRAHRLSEAG